MKKLCLGIESTAHTFSVGILDFEGTIYSLIRFFFYFQSNDYDMHWKILYIDIYE